MERERSGGRFWENRIGIGESFMCIGLGMEINI